MEKTFYKDLNIDSACLELHKIAKQEYLRIRKAAHIYLAGLLVNLNEPHSLNPQMVAPTIEALEEVVTTPRNIDVAYRMARTTGDFYLHFNSLAGVQHQEVEPWRRSYFWADICARQLNLNNQADAFCELSRHGEKYLQLLTAFHIAKKSGDLVITEKDIAYFQKDFLLDQERLRKKEEKEKKDKTSMN